MASCLLRSSSAARFSASAARSALMRSSSAFSSASSSESSSSSSSSCQQEPAQPVTTCKPHELFCRTAALGSSNSVMLAAQLLPKADIAAQLPSSATDAACIQLKEELPAPSQPAVSCLLFPLLLLLL
jgi:hypothetical protein